jgi:hypothetical protein
MARDDYKRGTGRGHRPERRISVRGVRREQPDLRKLAQALIALAQAQAEAEAQGQDEKNAATDEGLPKSKEAA